MNQRSSVSAILALLIAFGRPAFSQVQPPNPTQQQVQPPGEGPTPVFRVTVVSRSTKAINYRHRSGATKIDFRGTALLPKARGEAKVESKQGYIEIEVEFDDLSPATQFGPEFLTYVMWSITPEGRATNLGEVLLNGTKSKLNVTTEFQAFGLVVTAEPYFAVSQPSDVVVMENVVRADTLGKIEAVEAKYELLKRGLYTMSAGARAVTTRIDDSRVPLELYEARNAVELASFAGADRYAKETYQKAHGLLRQAEHYQIRKAGRKPVVMAAREAVQTAEDARLIAIQRIEAERLAEERQAAAAKAAEEVRGRQEAEAQARQAEAARAEAERTRAEMDLAAQRLAREKAEADAARTAAIAQQQAARLEAERAQRAAAEANQLRVEAEKERAELRARLLQQLNLILETRESARGLIVNMSDVLFDVDRHTLKPGTREKLARVAGILLAFPAGLKLEIEGHTDSTGPDDYNQRLSEQRAQSVRDYLVAQNIPLASILSVRGFGESRPVVTNDTSASRQQNRRVELVVSGEFIGPMSGLR